MHSTTYRRHLKKYQAEQALEQRVKAAIIHDENLRDGFTYEDQMLSEQMEARDLWRSFLAEEI